MLVRSASLVFASITALLLLAATAGCTGGGEPEAPASPAAVATASPAATATTSPAPAATSTVTATATASLPTAPRDSEPVSIYDRDILTEGAYKFSPPGLPTLYFDIPAGLRLTVRGRIQSEGGPYSVALLLDDVDSDSWILIDSPSGRESGRWTDPGASQVSVLFSELLRSVRVDPPPTPTPDPRVRAEAVARRRMAEAAALPTDISGWQFTERWLTAGVYQFALNPDEQPVIFQVPDGLRLALTFTGSMLDAPDRWCPGLRLVELVLEPMAVLYGSVLCLDVHHAAELSRTIVEKSAAAEDRFNRLVASLRLGPLPSDDAPARCAPVIEASYGPLLADPLRREHILTGGNTYLRRVGTGEAPPFVTFDVPTRVTLESMLEDQPDGSRTYGRLHLREATSSSRLVIDLRTGEEDERELLPVPEPYRVDVGAAFDRILASWRFDELPAIPGCPAPVVPSLAQTLGAGVYRYHMDPELYSGSAGLPDIILEVPAGLQLKVSLDDELATGFGLRLTHVETGSWLCLDAELLVECGRSVRPNTEHVGPLFDQIAESLRLGRLPRGP